MVVRNTLEEAISKEEFIDDNSDHQLLKATGRDIYIYIYSLI